MLKIIIIIIIIIIIAFIVFLIFNNNKPQQEGMKKESMKEKNSLDMIISNVLTEETTLKAVDGSDSSGKAYRLIEKGKLYHAVVATMSDLRGENKYEGWLVQPNPLKFFSTGVMKKNKEGLWVLEYTANKESPAYYRVVITEETVVDSTPEKHIIEGDFK